MARARESDSESFSPSLYFLSHHCPWHAVKSRCLRNNSVYFPFLYILYGMCIESICNLSGTEIAPQLWNHPKCSSFLDQWNIDQWNITDHLIRVLYISWLRSDQFFFFQRKQTLVSPVQFWVVCVPLILTFRGLMLIMNAYFMCQDFIHISELV